MDTCQHIAHVWTAAHSSFPPFPSFGQPLNSPCVSCTCLQRRVHRLFVFKQVTLKLSAVPWFIPKGELLRMQPEGRRGADPRAAPLCETWCPVFSWWVSVDDKAHTRWKWEEWPYSCLQHEHLDRFALRRKWLSQGVRGERWKPRGYRWVTSWPDLCPHHFERQLVRRDTFVSHPHVFLFFFFFNLTTF